MSRKSTGAVSFKFTKYGWVCVFLLCWLPLAAVTTANNFLFVLFAMVVGLTLVSHRMGKRHLRSVEVVRRFPEEIYAQTPFTLVYSLRSVQRRWGAVTITLHEESPLTSEGKPLLVRDVPPAARAEVSMLHTIEARGAHEIEPTIISSTFPFGLATFRRTCDNRDSVIVFPRVDPVYDDIPFQSGTPGQGAERLDPFGTIPMHFREYVPGDPYKHIEWKMTARTGKLATKVHSEELSGRVVISLPGDASEQALSKAASLVIHLARKGTCVALEGPGIRTECDTGKTFTKKLLTILAMWENPPVERNVEDGSLFMNVSIANTGEFQWRQGGLT